MGTLSAIALLMCGGGDAEPVVWSLRSPQSRHGANLLLRRRRRLPSPLSEEEPNFVLLLVLIFSGALLTPSPVDAQISPLQWEVRAGAFLPTSDLTGAQGFEGAASTAASFGVHFVLRSGLFSYVAGFSEHRFGCGARCGEAADFVSTAWDVGVRVNVREEGIIPWVSLGASAAVYDAHVGAGGVATRESSDRGWGYEAGAGVLIPVRGPFLLNPGIRYGSNAADFASRGGLGTRYFVADVGFVLAF